ncbi:transposase [Bradyrhizobium sp. CCBAU 51765]|uniref:IS110 family transposase n=1 Tax=Bradyrhizobium sp. CCBAU 51765 TaxID=1325102 RepID=UPI001FEDD399|nr:transposase [Bradyrhizobium sp. CCBAU 51765]
MMAQNSRVVVGIDVSKDKVDACIRSLSQRQAFPSGAKGRRKLVAWLRKHKVDRAVMEASGGYERDWAKALREACLAVRIVDPRRVRNFARSAGRLAKNDTIDADTMPGSLRRLKMRRAKPTMRRARSWRHWSKHAKP